jgi:hypothetical protein
MSGHGEEEGRMSVIEQGERSLIPLGNLFDQLRVRNGGILRNPLLPLGGKRSAIIVRLPGSLKRYPGRKAAGRGFAIVLFTSESPDP